MSCGINLLRQLEQALVGSNMWTHGVVLTFVLIFNLKKRTVLKAFTISLLTLSFWLPSALLKISPFDHSSNRKFYTPNPCPTVGTAGVNL